MRPWFIYLVVALLTVASSGRDDPVEALERDWRAAADEAKLSPAAIKHLEREKVLMTKDEYLQCYQAYLPGYSTRNGEEAGPPALPYFITTDSLFQAYAWCLQKGTARMETAHAGQMREYLRVLMSSLNQVNSLVEGDSVQIQKAKETAIFVVGVAAVLMDVKVAIKPEAVGREVEQEAALVRQAQGTRYPVRLKVSPQDPSRLDYTLFKPVGLYAGDELMEEYFRAVRWLQLVPFRAASDEHMLAAAMLALSHSRQRLLKLKLDEEVARQFEDREDRLNSLAGNANGSGVLRCVSHPLPQEKPTKKAAEWIEEARKSITPMDASKEERNGVVITTSPKRDSSNDATAHVILASTMTDAILLEKLSQAKGPSYFPNTLSIASWLGSGYAAEWGKKDDKAKVICQDARRWLSNKADRPSLHLEGLMLLQQLVEPPPADAPAYMKSRSWQAKSCQTVLAAWAQSRHVWALQAQPQYSVGAGMREWPAFVERAPDFFVGLAGLCRKAKWTLQVPESETLINERIARKLRQMANESVAQVSSREKQAFEAWISTVEMLVKAGVKYQEGPFTDPAAVTKCTQILRESAEVIARGEGLTQHPVAQKLRERLAEDRKEPWHELENTCLRLAVLAHKQARELPPNTEETEWLLAFGVHLSSFSDCHFTSPLDNVPKAVRVFTNPELGKALTAGIGRPRFLYVLHPWQGKEVLCRGAVLPYLERHELESLTDEEWKQKLDDPKSQAIQPEWIKPLLAE